MSERVHVTPLDHLKRDIAGNLLRLTDLSVTGYENLKLLNGPAIFDIFPHTSHLDSWTLRYALPQEQKHSLVFLAKKKYWDGRRRPFGELTNALILIQTDEGTIAKDAMRTAVNCMTQGYSIGISTEGTRTLKPIEDRPFEQGIYLLLRLTQFEYPLVPVLLQGFKNVWPKGQIPMPIEKRGVLFRRKRVNLHFGTPILYKEKDFANKDELVEDFRQNCIRQFKEKFIALE